MSLNVCVFHQIFFSSKVEQSISTYQTLENYPEVCSRNNEIILDIYVGIYLMVEVEGRRLPTSCDTATAVVA